MRETNIQSYKPIIDGLFHVKNLDSLKRHPNQTSVQTRTTAPTFSICMCVYNFTEILYSSITSVYNQTFQDWELIILDNGSSNESVWSMIKHAMELDSRIHGMRMDENTGWAKGAGICLERATGKYMTFLAADDCLHPDALSMVNEEIKTHKPDIVWVGNAYVEYSKENVHILAVNIPKKRILREKDRVQNSFDILSTVYYNSMFHYIRIDFLKEHNLDFFKPYYADCATMTYAMTKAKDMVILDQLIYFLTMNTSQTSNHYIWNKYELFFASQWISLKNMLLEEGVFSEPLLASFSKKILRNLIGSLMDLCSGGECRNEYMNALDKQPYERFQELEATLSNPETIEMMEYYGRNDFFDNVKPVLHQYATTYGVNDDATSSSKWLKAIVLYLCSDHKDNYIIEFIHALLHPMNQGMFGFELFINDMDAIDNHTFIQIAPFVKQVLHAFGNKNKVFLQRMNQDFLMSSQLKAEHFRHYKDYFMLIYNQTLDILKKDEDLDAIKREMENALP